MGSDLCLSTAAANASVDAVARLLSGGSLRIYGAPRPVDADSPASGDLLVELSFSEPAFGPASNGGAVANPILATVATGTGEAAWFRAVGASGQAVFDGKVGTDLILASTAISAGIVVSVSMDYSALQRA